MCDDLISRMMWRNGNWTGIDWSLLLLVIKDGCHLQQLAGAYRRCFRRSSFWTSSRSVIEINSLLNRHVSCLRVDHKWCTVLGDRSELTGTCDPELLGVWGRKLLRGLACKAILEICWGFWKVCALIWILFILSLLLILRPFLSFFLCLFLGPFLSGAHGRVIPVCCNLLNLIYINEHILEKTTSLFGSFVVSERQTCREF